MNDMYVSKLKNKMHNLLCDSLFRGLLLLVLSVTVMTASGAYIVHSVSGNVTLVTKEGTQPLTKGMKINPNDMVDIPANGVLEILNDLDSKVYTSVAPGRITVMRLMLNARQKASDNAANVGDYVMKGAPSQTDGRIYMEKGMVKRAVLYVSGDSMAYASSDSGILSLVEELGKLAKNVPGIVGIAFVSDSDTLTVNNDVAYPMMSVFKLYQALAVADRLRRDSQTPDSAIYIPFTDLDRDTWSPMLETYGKEDFMITIGELLRFSLSASDNNASNLLFKRMVSPSETETFVKTVAQDTTFSIVASEAMMKSDHGLSYANHTSPLSAAFLMRDVFTKEIVPAVTLDSIRSDLSEAITGLDRLGAPIKDEVGVFFAHKTGSGYRNAEGELIAHNDVGYFRLPDGRDYALAVFIRDFNGTEEEASALIAEISRLVYTRRN